MEITGCSGDSCYAPSTCKPLIDAARGPNARAAKLAVLLDACMDNTRCRGQ
jgi:hypothetical protein